MKLLADQGRQCDQSVDRPAVAAAAAAAAVAGWEEPATQRLSCEPVVCYTRPLVSVSCQSANQSTSATISPRWATVGRRWAGLARRTESLLPRCSRSLHSLNSSRLDVVHSTPTIPSTSYITTISLSFSPSPADSDMLCCLLRAADFHFHFVTLSLIFSLIS